MTFDSEPPTLPTHGALLMTMPQAREALNSVPPDGLQLVMALLRTFYNEGFMTAQAGGSRVFPLDRDTLRAPSMPEPRPKRHR